MSQYLGSSLHVRPQQHRGVVLALAPLALLLPRPSEPLAFLVSLPETRCTYTHAHSLGVSRMRIHGAHKQEIIPKRVSFPHSGRGSKVEELSLSRWVGRGCGGAAATERRSAVGTLDRMIPPSQRGYFSPAAISRLAILSTKKQREARIIAEEKKEGE